MVRIISLGFFSEGNHLSHSQCFLVAYSSLSRVEADEIFLFCVIMTFGVVPVQVFLGTHFDGDFMSITFLTFLGGKNPMVYFLDLLDSSVKGDFH